MAQLATGFNEAAGIPRGRHVERLHLVDAAVDGFNEAAGIPRGRHGERGTYRIKTYALQ